MSYTCRFRSILGLGSWYVKAVQHGVMLAGSKNLTSLGIWRAAELSLGSWSSSRSVVPGLGASSSRQKHIGGGWVSSRWVVVELLRLRASVGEVTPSSVWTRAWCILRVMTWNARLGGMSTESRGEIACASAPWKTADLTGDVVGGRSIGLLTWERIDGWWQACACGCGERGSIECIVLKTQTHHHGGGDHIGRSRKTHVVGGGWWNCWSVCVGCYSDWKLWN